jgi:hypothetical protein
MSGRYGRENTQPKDEEENTLRFHYDRDERIRQAGNSLGNIDKRPWYRKNRGTLILLLDVSLIVVIFILYNAFLRPNLTTEDFGDHRYELRAVEFDGEILATLRITADEQLVSGSAGTVLVEMYPDGRADLAVRTLELLPENPDQPRIVRLRFPADLIDPDDGLTVIGRADVRPTDDQGDWDFSLSASVELE